MFGGGNRSIFDGVNLVSRSVAIGKPVVSINMNYRVGLGGFLASKDILEDLKKDGYGGVGNFGLTDQQTALEWVQKYIPTFGGDKDNVTVFGLSAGGISIGHLLRAKQPAVFHRAISMSGVESTIQTLSLQSHEEIYQRLLAYFKIDGSAPDALEQLRAIPEVQVADSTFEVYATINVISSPCDDGHFHISPPDRSVYHTPPEWLKSYMAGVVGEEGEIFVNSVDPAIDYQWVKDVYAKSMTATEAEMILKLYGLSADADADAIVKFIKTLQGDWAFSIHLWKTLQASTLPETYGYHFDLVRPSLILSPILCMSLTDFGDNRLRKSRAPSSAPPSTLSICNMFSSTCMPTWVRKIWPTVILWLGNISVSPMAKRHGSHTTPTANGEYSHATTRL